MMSWFLQSQHPQPGAPYSALQTTAYLPNNTVGRHLCSGLKKAFDLGLTFTLVDIGVEGYEAEIVFDIEHKTATNSGPDR